MSNIITLDFSKTLIRRVPIILIVIIIPVLIVASIIISSQNTKTVPNIRTSAPSEKKPQYTQSQITSEASRFIKDVFTYNHSNKSAYMSDSNINNIISTSLLASIKSDAQNNFGSLYDVTATVTGTNIPSIDHHTVYPEIVVDVTDTENYLYYPSNGGQPQPEIENNKYDVAFDQLPGSTTWTITSYNRF